jgi:hypothetical protein
MLLHHSTAGQIENYLKDPAQALALLGPDGAGKGFLADNLVDQLLKVPADTALTNGFLYRLEPEDGKTEIGIEAVRQTLSKLSLKAHSASPGRVVLIKDAHRLGLEAQNAMLKTLEEPGVATYFIFTIPDTKSIMPTILSRLETIEVKPVDLTAAANFFDVPETDIKPAWQLSKGLAGLLSRLLEDHDNPLRRGIHNAKHFLGIDRYERLIFLEPISKDRSEMQIFLTGLGRVLEAAHRAAVGRNDIRTAKRLSAARRTVIDLKTKQAANTSAKLLTLDIVSSLKV